MSATVVSSSIVVPSVAGRVSRDESSNRDAMQTSMKRSADEEGLNDGSTTINNERDEVVEHSNMQDQEPPKRPRLDVNNPELKKRGQRLFANMLGTLTKFKAESQHKSDAELQREQIDAKLQEKLRREKEELTAKVQQEQEERRQKMIEKKKEEDEMRETEMHRVWAAQKSNLTNFFRTKTTPVLYYLPRKLTNEMMSLIAEQKRELALASSSSVPPTQQDNTDTEMDVDQPENEHRYGSQAETGQEHLTGRNESEDKEMHDVGMDVGNQKAASDSVKDEEQTEGAATSNIVPIDIKIDDKANANVQEPV